MKYTTGQFNAASSEFRIAPLVATALVILALYYGREVFIPLALAILLSFLLTVPVTILERARFGRKLSVVIVLVVAFSALGSIAWLGATQIADIVLMLPAYQENIHRKIEAMQNPAGSALAKAVESFKSLNAELSQTESISQTRQLTSRSVAGKAAQTSVQVDKHPLAVQVIKPESGVVDSIGLVSATILRFAELAGGVVVFTLFMLIQRSDLRNRLFRLFGQNHLNLMTTALDDAARRVSKYLVTQSLVNGAFGLSLGVGLHLIGVPFAPFWGVLGAILRFIPYIGSFVSGLCPLILALAVFEGWTKPLLTLALFAAIELITSVVVEPLLYGAHTGVSSLAILISAAFWTLLWGPIGLILATPLTVCLLVLGRYIPALSPLAVLLGDQPVLPPEACFYQRLLAGDEDEAQEVAETFLKDHSMVELYDMVLIPALLLSERDRHDNILENDRAEFVYQETRSLIENLETFEVTGEHAISQGSQVTALCVPARDKADELVALMLCQVLKRSGIKASTVPVGSTENRFDDGGDAPDIIFVSALPPLALSHARSTCRALRRSFSGAKIIVGVWNSASDKVKAQERWAQGTCDDVVLTLKDAVAEVNTPSASGVELTASLAGSLAVSHALQETHTQTLPGVIVPGQSGA